MNNHQSDALSGEIRQTPPISLLAASLRRERERAGLSVTELAKRAGLAKSTLSQLETGIGNPSLETIWALASTLGVQVSRLIAEPRTHIHVIRRNEGVTTVSESGSYAATLLAVCPPGAQRDIYRVHVQPGEPHISKPHGYGTIEHVILSTGRAKVGLLTESVILAAGDYISYAADVPHIFEALDEDAFAIMMIEHA